MSADELGKLAELYKSGLLSKAEFEVQKRAVLNKTANDGVNVAIQQKKGSLFGKAALVVIAGIAILAFIGSQAPRDFNSSSNSADSSGPSKEALLAQAVSAVMPSDEKALLAAVAAGQRQYDSGANEMAKGASRPARANRICSTMQSKQARDWIGKVSTLNTNGDGKGVLGIEIGPNTNVATWSNSLSDIGEHTLIEPSTQLFSTATSLYKGQMVKFSGSFFPSQTDCIKEQSMSLWGSVTDPAFIFKFESVAPFTPPVQPSPTSAQQQVPAK